MIEFTVNSKPQGKARARTFYDHRLGKMKSVTPIQTKFYEELIRWSYAEAGGEYMGEKLMQVDIRAFYPIPKTWSKKKKQAAASGELRPTTKPDCDNVIKVVLDALNGVAYYDDKQVVCVSCSKYYSPVDLGYMKIKIQEAKKE